MRKATTSTRSSVKLLLIALLICVAMLASMPASAAPAQAMPDINGGASWSGWTYFGNAQDPGVYAAQSADFDFDIYYTTFILEPGAVADAPANKGNDLDDLSKGSFQAGDVIYGVGVEFKNGDLGGESTTMFIKWDPNGTNTWLSADEPGGPYVSGSGGGGTGYTQFNNVGYNFGNQGTISDWYARDPNDPTGPTIAPTGANNFLNSARDFWGQNFTTPDNLSGFKEALPYRHYAVSNGAGGLTSQIWLINASAFERAETGGYRAPFQRFQEGWSVQVSIGSPAYAKFTDALVRDLPTLPSVGPEIAEAVVCDEATVDIAVNNVSDLYGYEFKVLYDDSLVSAVGAFQYGWFDTNASGQSVTGWKGNCANGVCKFARTETYPDAAVSGSGVVASVDFTSLLPAAPASFDVQVVDLILTDKDGFQITPAEAGSIQVEVCGNATVSGTISLQGRLVPNGHDFSVTLTGPYGTFTAPPTIDQTNGTYTVSGVKYTSGGTNYAIQADHSLYLKNAKDPLLVNGDLTGEDTRLLGGDANNNGAVGIGDLSCIGTDFGTANTDACGAFPNSTDINNDTVVNIQDLAIAGGNFSLDDDPPLPW